SIARSLNCSRAADVLEFDEVTVRVPGPTGDLTLLDGITIDLPERRIAVIGGNGGGKSTLVRLVNGLVTPSEGRVLVDGVDVAKHAAAVRRRVGFVFTNPSSQLV